MGDGARVRLGGLGFVSIKKLLPEFCDCWRRGFLTRAIVIPGRFHGVAVKGFQLVRVERHAQTRKRRLHFFDE